MEPFASTFTRFEAKLKEDLGASQNSLDRAAQDGKKSEQNTFRSVCRQKERQAKEQDTHKMAVWIGEVPIDQDQAVFHTEKCH